MYKKEFLEAQKRRLLEAERELLTGLGKVAVYDKGEDEWTPIAPEYDEGDPEDLGDTAEEATVLGRNQARMRDLLQDLEEVRQALTKMKEGRYGFCENCGQYIDEKRLQAYPAAQNCLKCLRPKNKSI